MFAWTSLLLFVQYLVSSFIGIDLQFSVLLYYCDVVGPSDVFKDSVVVSIVLSPTRKSSRRQRQLPSATQGGKKKGILNAPACLSTNNGCGVAWRGKLDSGGRHLQQQKSPWLGWILSFAGALACLEIARPKWDMRTAICMNGQDYCFYHNTCLPVMRNSFPVRQSVSLPPQQTMQPWFDSRARTPAQLDTVDLWSERPCWLDS